MNNNIASTDVSHNKQESQFDNRSPLRNQVTLKVLSDTPALVTPQTAPHTNHKSKNYCNEIEVSNFEDFTPFNPNDFSIEPYKESSLNN